MANGPARYAPAPPAGPSKLASLTLESVDQLGQATAIKVRQTADDLEKGAHEIAEKLRRLADNMEHHATEANKTVSAFCDRAMEVFHGTLDLQARLNGETKPAQHTEEQQHHLDQDPVPGFLTQGGDQ